MSNGSAALNKNTESGSDSPVGKVFDSIIGVSKEGRESGKWTRIFTQEGVHPFDSIKWKIVDSKMVRADGSKVFEQLDVEVPDWWNETTINVVVSKYFRMVNGVKETSAKQLFSRVARTLTQWADEQQYFNSPKDAEIYEAELIYALLHQYGAFNSPVWFNVGIPDRRQAASACFISGVDDTLDSIMEFSKSEKIIFAGGSGSGANLSKIRSSYEKLSSGAYVCGPLGWMEELDKGAKAMKSGGSTRNAAKMAIMDMDHPDILETMDGRPGFIRCKAIEEKRAHDLIECGYSAAYDDPNSAYKWVSFQNANHSVSIPDAFMQAVVDDGMWKTRERLTGEVVHEYKARELWTEIAQAAWMCGDPGVQFTDTINRWHTTPSSGRIRATNPCAEFAHVDNTACNLCAINLTRMFDDGKLNTQRFMHSVRVFVTAQNAIIAKADYPTDSITKNSLALRPIGLNYGDLGSLLMQLGHAYNSDEGRAIAARLASLMTGYAYLWSAKLAARTAAFSEFEKNRDAMLNIMHMHREANRNISKRWNLGTFDPLGDDVCALSDSVWEEVIKLGERHGFSISQASLQAPLGCLIAGSLIATDLGLIRIEDLGNPDGEKWQDVEFMVQTDAGPRQATQFYVNGEDDIIGVTTDRGFQLRGTPKHQIKVIVNGQWEWRRFDALKEGDVVPLSMNQLFGESRQISLPKLPASLVPNYDRGVRIPNIVDIRLAELCGLFAANGSTHHKGLRFAFDAQDCDARERCAGFIRELFGKDPTITSADNCISLCLNSTQIKTWWSISGFAKIEVIDHLEAHVPDAILATNDKRAYGAYLRGLFTCDGSVTNGLPSLTNKSEAFIRDVQTMLLAVGIPTRFDIQTGGYSDKPVYRLTVTSRNFTSVFMERVGFTCSRKADKVLGKTEWARDYIYLDEELFNEVCPIGHDFRKIATMRYIDGRIPRHIAEKFIPDFAGRLQHALSFYYDEITTVESQGRQLTYDISVPGNVTYIANGFVSHNTISFLMGMNTTGIEPAFALVSYKSLVGGGVMKLVNGSVKAALVNLGYSEPVIQGICEYLEENSFIEGAPGLLSEHLPIFDCAMASGPSGRCVPPLGHLKMMAAIQPLITCAQSKTVNLPTTASPEEIADLYKIGWELGLKCIALYRDGCKKSQPLKTKNRFSEESGSGIKETVREVIREVRVTDRRKMPIDSHSRRHKFNIAGHTGYIIVGEYDDGSPGEVFVRLGKIGSTMGGLVDSFTKLLSISIQHGVPLEKLVRCFVNTKFEPSGYTGNPKIRFTDSLYDYIFKYIDLTYFSGKNSGLDKAYGNTTTTPESITPTAIPASELSSSPNNEMNIDAPPCNNCGSITRRCGSCYLCSSCGNTTGCS